MSAARVEAAGEWRLAVHGPLRFATVTGLLGGLPAAPGNLTLDLSAVDGVDSAGLALLVEWQRRARAAGGRLEFTGAPAQLRRLAEIGGVDTLLGLSQADSEART